jgi:hypothetical protein
VATRVHTPRTDRPPHSTDAFLLVERERH